MNGIKEAWDRLPTAGKIFIAFIALVIIGDLLTQGGAI